jgi:hypothetical protein
LEDNYIASQRSGKDKMIIENEAKQYITKGLTNVLKDIEVASLNIDQLLQMQGMAVDSLADDVSLIKSRLQGMKSQHLTASLDEMKVPYTAAHSGTAAGTAGASVRRVEVDYLLSRPVPARAAEADSDEEGRAEGEVGTAAVATAAAAVRRKVSIEERYGITMPLPAHCYNATSLHRPTLSPVLHSQACEAG